MTKYKQITELFKDTSLKNNARKLCNNRDIFNDLFQETFIYLLELPDEKFNRINNLKAFAFTVMFGKANSQARNYNLNGKDNVLFEMSNKFGIFDGTNIAHSEYNYKIDEDFDKVISYLNADNTIKETDVYVLFESTNDKTLKELSKDLDMSYHTIRLNRKKLIKKIINNVVL